MPTAEYPNQDYWPTWKVRLSIRFEEYGQVTTLTAKVPKKTTKNLDGVKVDRDNLSVGPDPTAPPGVHRLILGSSTSPYGAGQDQVSSSDGLTQEVGGIIPRSFSWTQNGLRTADTLTARIKYIDCPVDPRTIRACAIQFYLGTVTAAEYAAGIGGKTRGDVFGSGTPNAAEPMNMIADTYLDGNGTQRTNLRFQGWVDKWHITWDDENEPYIELECTDNTRLFIEQEAPPRLVLGMKDPIDKAVATYLSHFPQLAGLAVEYRPAGATVPVLDKLLSHSAFRPKLGPQPRAAGASQGSKLTIWDYLTDVCGSIGHAIYLDGTTLVIQLPRTLTSSALGARPNDPFQGRALPGGNTFSIRRFIYGRNIKKMEVERSFTKKQALNVEVRSYDPSQKTILVERFPLPADRLAYAIPGNATPDQKWTVIRVNGIVDKATLRRVAQTYYEVIGRNELAVDVQTYSFASFGGGATDPDILDMKFGDSFDLLVNRDDTEATSLTQMEKQLTAFQRNVEFFQTLGFSNDFASTYAKVYTASAFQTAYRTRSLRFDGDVDQGVSIKLQGVNYIEVRADQSLAAGEEPK
jgi:hypothetical protein